MFITHRLTVVESTHNRVRTKVTEGELQATPEIGAPLYMKAPPLIGDNHERVRIIHTTPIKEIENHPNHKIIKTQNSTYMLEDIFNVPVLAS